MSARLPALKPRQVTRALEKHGFVLHRIRGSHYIYIHPNDDTLLVVVPHHGKDIKKGTLRAIIRDAGLTMDEFLNLL